jgi:hypothetical protein
MGQSEDSANPLAQNVTLAGCISLSLASYNIESEVRDHTTHTPQFLESINFENPARTKHSKQNRLSEKSDDTNLGIEIIKNGTNLVTISYHFLHTTKKFQLPYTTNLVPMLDASMEEVEQWSSHRSCYSQRTQSPYTKLC